MISAPPGTLHSIHEFVSIVCLMFSFLDGLRERGVNVRCEARDCFHFIVHLVNMSPVGYYYKA